MSIMAYDPEHVYGTEYNLYNVADPNSFSGYVPNESHRISTSPLPLILRNFTSVLLQQPKPKVTFRSFYPLPRFCLLTVTFAFNFHMFICSPQIHLVLQPLASLHFISSCNASFGFICFSNLPRLMNQIVFHPSTHQNSSCP